MVRALALTAVLLAGLSIALARLYSSPMPYAAFSSETAYTAVDLAGAVFGVRRLAADIAWIQLLQYYGTPERPLSKEQEYRLSWDMTKYLFGIDDGHDSHDRDGGGGGGEEYHAQIDGGKYAGLLSYCYRIVALDPFYTYAYLYGGGALAWNLNRPEEALELLRHGITVMERCHHDLTRDVQQPYWQLNLYVSAIVYRTSGDHAAMVRLLETAVRQPAAPNMVKAILANIYQKQNNLPAAARLWLEIYDSKDPSYRATAEKKLAELQRYLAIPQQS